MTDFTAYLRLGVDSRDAVSAQKDLDRMAAAGDKSDKSFKQLSGTSKLLGASIGGIGLAAATAKVIDYADAWTNVSNVLMGVTDSSAAFASTQAKVLALSKDTFSSLEGTAGLYSEITRSVSELGINQERVLGVTRTINNLFLAGGKAASETAGAIRQLNQGLASGALRGDEFNSVAEGAPRILDALSQKLNITKGELRGFAAEGKITAELLISALEDYSDEAQKAVDTTTRTFSQSAELARTFALEFVGASEGIKEFSAAAGSALVTVAQNLDLVSDAVIILSVAYGARLAGSLATATAAKVASIASARALAISENDAAVGIARRATVEAAAAKVALDKARADTIAATATLNNVRANGLATQSVAPLIAALNAQAVAQQKLTASIGGSAAATAAANAANAKLAATGAAVAGTSALATAVRGLGAAMALIGGPVGVAILAGGALYYLATSATEAEETLDNLRAASGAASERLTDMAKSAQAVAAIDLSEKLEGLVKYRDELSQSIGDDAFFSEEYLIRTTEDIRLLNDEISKLQGQLDSIKPPTAQVQNFVDSISSLNNVLGFFVAGNGVSKPFSLFSEGAGSVKTFTEEYTKLSSQVEQSIALFGDEKKSSELAYLARTGQLKEMSAEEAALLVARYESLEQLQETADKTKELNEAEKSRAESIASSIAELEKQNALFGEQSKYAEILYEIEAGLLKVTDAEKARYLAAAQTNDQLEANKNLADSMESFAKQSEDDKAALDELISSVDEFGGAWSRTGSIVADSLGTIGDALSDNSSRMAAIASKESELAKARMKFIGDPKELEKIGKAEKKLATERTAANLKSFGAIAGAASEMFDEQSKARRTLHGIEVAFNAVEMAMTIGRSLLAAKEAVLTQGKGDPYTAFARMAAMGAAVAALGYAVGGGGGGGGQSAQQIQESQGTGSVFGSNDKSESISTAFEEYADIGIEQLGELRMIREGLTGLTGGINKLSIGVITSGLTEAKYVNFANQYVGEILNSGMIKTRGTRSQDIAGREMLAPLQGQIASIFGYIEESVNAATGALEIAQNNPAWKFITDIGKVSFEGLSGEEIQSELNAIFSQQADLITEFVVPAMKEYQQIGEGLFETLTRVAAEMATFNYYTDALGLDFNMTGLAAIAAQQAIAGFSGGMDKLTENLQSYYEEFFTEEERAANQMKLLAAEMKNLGYDAVPTSREAFRALVEGIDLTTEAGQKQFAGLIALNEVFAELVPATESAAAAVESAADAMERLKSEAQNAFDAVNKSVSAERARIQGIVGSASAAKQALDKSIAAEKNQIDAAYKERIDQLNSLADEERKIAQANADAQNEAQRALSQARIDSISQEKSAVEDRIGGLKSLFDQLASASSDIAPKTNASIMAARRLAEMEIDTALRNAAAGRGLPTDGRLNTALESIRENPSSNYASAQDMAYANAVLQNKLAELSGYTEKQLTAEERALSILEAQLQSAQSDANNFVEFAAATTTKYDDMIAQANAQYANDLANLDLIAKNAQEQFDKLTGIDTRTLSVEEALTKFNESLLAADFEDAQQQYARLDGILEQGKLQLDTLLDIDSGVLSLRDAIDRFAAAVNSADQKKANEELLAEMRRTADELNQLREEQRVQALTQQSKLDETARNTRITANEALA